MNSQTVLLHIRKWILLQQVNSAKPENKNEEQLKPSCRKGVKKAILFTVMHTFQIRFIIIVFLAVISCPSKSQEVPIYGNSYIGAGIWMPTGKLTTLGNHPYIGLSMGFGVNRFTMNMVFDIRFLKSKNFYDFTYRDSVYSTNSYFGGYLGFDFGYCVFQREKLRLDAIGGIGYDGFDALFPEAFEGNEASTHSYNFNLGGMFKYRVFGERHLALICKYNFVDNTLGDRTNLSGNAWNMGLVFLFSGGEKNASPAPVRKRNTELFVSR